MKPFKFEDVFIGRTPDRARIFIDAEWDGTRLSLTGTMIEHGRRNTVSIGQITDDVRTVLPRLADLWDRWHLNDMRAGCEHQEHIFRLNPAARPTWKNDYKGSTGITLSPESGSTCYECGYKYGSAWNVEPVPESVLIEIHTMLSDPHEAAAAQKMAHTCSTCGATLVNEDCPRYGNGPEHALVAPDFDCETEAFALSDCKHWDKPGTECAGPRVGKTPDGVILCERHYNQTGA